MKDGEIVLRIEAFDEANGGGVGWYKDKGAYHLYLLTTEAPIARLKPVGTTDEVRLGYWSHRRKWKISTTWADASYPSIKPSTTSQTTAFSGPGPDEKRTKSSLRIELKQLQAAMGHSPTLLAVLLKYVQASMVQLAHTAVTNAHHRMEARLSRWLLMCHDRVEGDEVQLTHRFMSMMITAQRSSVTITLHILEGTGAIRSTRGLVTILNRERLEDIAGDAYGSPEAEYRRLIAPFGRSADAR